MIGMAGENLLRAVELLEQHGPGEEMGPGHDAERQQEMRLLANRVGEPLGAADEKSEIADAAVSPALYALGEAFARQRLAARIERHEGGSRRRRREQQRAFALLDLVRGKRTFLLDVAEAERPGDSLGIISRERLMRSALEAADGDHMKAHAPR